MYLDHFSLKEKPFQISADPRFLWLGSKHKEALAILKYGIFDNRGFLLLSGDVGTGKTTLIHALLRSLGEDTLVAMVPDPGLSLMDLYRYIAKSFRITEAFDSKQAFLDIFKAFLLHNEEQEKKVLLIIDESQRLTSELLEEIRLLSNIEKDYTKLLNIFFVGQNEFNNIILAQRNRPLRQRITINYNIEPLEKPEVMEYIRYRLAVAGCESPLFTAEAVHDVYSFSEGYPRLINIICDHALLTAYVQSARQVDDAIVRECAEELRIKLLTPHSSAPPAVKTLARAATTEPVQPTPLLSTMPPLAVPPPQPNTSSSQTMLLIIFGLLCFIAGLLAFALRDRPQVATTGTARVVVTNDASENLSSSIPAADASTRDAPPPSGVETDSAQDATTPTLEETTVDDREQTSVQRPLDAEANAPSEGSATDSTTKASASAQTTEGEDDALETPGADNPLPEKLIIYFQIDSNELDDDTLRELDKLAAGMNQRPRLPIRITGYTDAAGNLHYNFKVSEFRANIVKSFLVGKGIEPERIVSRGLGPANPIASNETLAGRRLNRRVEIELVAE
ncbi:MAG: AAA family ATPase [Desulfobacterales bacterium]|nr:AAA family ATPase [Desulfobacterales bacterium]